MNKGLLLLSSFILTVLLVGIIWLLNLPVTSAPYQLTISGEGAPLIVAQANEDSRFKAVLECLPKDLGNNTDQDFQARLKQALDEMGNDQLERIFNRIDNPKLSQSEIQFKNCLTAKGFAPQSNYKQSSFDQS